MENRSFYNEILTEHNLRPEFKHDLPDADLVLEGVNPNCGDDIWLKLKVKDGIIEDVKFNTFGCGSAIASSSMATEMIKGKSIDDALELSNKAVVEALDGLPTHKIHCSVLAEEAVKAAVKDYYDKNGIEYDKEKFAPDDCPTCGE